MKTIIDYITANPWIWLITYEVAVRLIPTDSKYYSLLALVDRIFPNLKKGGGFHILILGLISFSLSAQNNGTFKTLYSTNVSDTAFAQTTRTNIQNANGNTGGLYFDKTRNKWKIWVGTCSSCSVDSAWVDLPLFASSGINVTAPLVKTGSTISIPKATSLIDGYLFHTDWNNFNTKVSGSLTAVRIPFAVASHKLRDNTNLKYDTVNSALNFSTNSAKLFNVGAESIYLGINAGNFTENTSGSHGNVGIGVSTMNVNTTGHQTVAVGVYALQNNTTGNAQVAIGSYALNSSNGDNNVAVGNHALFSAGATSDNIAVGRDALFSTTTGSNSVAIGSFSQRANTVGIDNVGIGYGSLNGNVNGNANTALGHNSLFSINGDFNTAVGFNSGVQLASGTRNVFLGAYSGYNETGISNALLINNSNDSTTLPYLLRGFFDKGTMGISTHGKNNATLSIGKVSGYAPLYIESGSLLASVKNNTIENNGTHLYYSQGGTRYQLDQQTGTPSGSNTQIQYNNSGSFGASSNFTFNSGGTILNVGNSTTTGLSILQDQITHLNPSANFGIGVADNLSGNGGTLTIGGGNSTGSNGNGGNITISAGSKNGSGTNGSIYLNPSGSGSSVFVGSGSVSGDKLLTVSSSTSDAGLIFTMTQGNGSGVIQGNIITLTSTNGMTLNGGNIDLTPAGNITLNPTGGSDINLTGNSGNGRYIIVSGLPTTCSGAPTGALANVGGVLTICP